MEKMSWDDLFMAGTLIEATRHCWRARIQLKAEDLGIEKTEEVKKALSFGCHRLVPKKAFDEIEAITRRFDANIAEHSLKFPLLQDIRFVPDAQVPELQRKLNMRVREYEIAVEEFLIDYDKNQAEMLEIIKVALKDAAKTEEAAANALLRIEREYPTRAEVSEKFGLEWTFFSLTLPTSKTAAQQAKATMPQVAKAVTSMVEGLRKELADKVASLLDVAKNVRSGKSLSKTGFAEPSKEAAKAVLDKVSRLNFFGDAVLTEQIGILRGLLDNSDMDTLVKELGSVKVTLQADIEAAAAEAERKLTGLGNRKIQF